jgi:hypothetical protein
VQIISFFCVNHESFIAILQEYNPPQLPAASEQEKRLTTTRICHFIRVQSADRFIWLQEYVQSFAGRPKAESSKKEAHWCHCVISEYYLMLKEALYHEALIKRWSAGSRILESTWSCYFTKWCSQRCLTKCLVSSTCFGTATIPALCISSQAGLVLLAHRLSFWWISYLCLTDWLCSSKNIFGLCLHWSRGWIIDKWIILPLFDRLALHTWALASFLMNCSKANDGSSNRPNSVHG